MYRSQLKIINYTKNHEDIQKNKKKQSVYAKMKINELLELSEKYFNHL